MSNFSKLATKLASQGAQNPSGLAYAIGAKKFSRGVMAKAAAQGKPAAVVARKQKGR
jgi:hypothetical protein